MTDIVKDYIEMHSDDLDNNLNQFFEDAGEILSEKVIGDLIDVLEEAGIETTAPRLYAVHQYLTRVFKGIRNINSLNKIPLQRMLEDFLQSWMCFDVPRIMDYVFDHKDSWAAYAKFFCSGDDYENWMVKAL